jgi:hypothetical protein
MGGAKIPRFLKAINAPSPFTVEKHWRENLVVLDDGITDHNFSRLVEVYSRAREVLKVPKDTMIPCELSEDESAILKGLQYCPKRNVIDGVCGEWGVTGAETLTKRKGKRKNWLFWGRGSPPRPPGGQPL